MRSARISSCSSASTGRWYTASVAGAGVGPFARPASRRPPERVIDLHLHSTASDGRLAPADLIARAAAAGLSIVSLTDHDTTAGLAEARAAAGFAGIRLLDGIEITAVEDGRDVHVLGYFIDSESPALADFLRTQRADRIRRVRDIGERLASLGIPVDVSAAIARASQPGARSVGRPAIADLLIQAGHAVDRRDAFDRLLGQGRPAFVPRCGAPVAQIVEIIHRAGGIASLAHPALTGVDEEIPRFAQCGLDALEARHSDHDAATETRYRALASALRLAISGGSDFHCEGDGLPHAPALGVICLPPHDFESLEHRALERRRHEIHGRT